jgi:diphthine synthase
MTLNLIGLGLNDEKDITVKGLELVKSSDIVYLENYTSVLQCSLQDLEEFYGKKIVLADRQMSEQGMENIIEKAKAINVSFLIVGDPFSATTHVEIFRLAMEKDVKVNIVNNTSVLTAVGIVGLELYKYGKTTSIPFIDEHPNLETPYDVIASNKKMGLHTLCLLDLRPADGKFMTVKEALEVLENIESRKQEKNIYDDLLVIGCARLGSEDVTIKSGTLKEIKKHNFGKPPHCLIVPGNLHFVEEDVLKEHTLP